MDRTNTIIAVFGRKGLGKTYLVKWLCRNCRRMILIDSLKEYNNGTVYHSFDELALATNEPEFRLVFRPLKDNDFDRAVDLAVAVGNCTLVIDEVDKMTSSYDLPESLRNAIHYGRHYNVDIIIAARMAQRIRSDITAQADIILSFQQQGKTSVAYMREFSELDIDNEIKILFSRDFIVVAGNFSLDKPPKLN
jgi:hypothetical protein